MKARLEGVCGKAEKFNQQDSAKVEIKRRILLVELSLDGTRQNKSFRRVAYPPKNLVEHTRRRWGDVNGILTHKEGKDWGVFSLPESLRAVCQERFGTGGIGGGMGPVPSALKTGFATVPG